MTRRAASLGLFSLSMLCIVACLVVPAGWGSGASGLKDALLGTGSFALPFVLVGLVVSLRRPDHPVGWGFAAAGLCSSIQAASVAYADAALRAGADLPGALVAANLTQWIFAPGVYLGFTMVFLRFPNGHLLGRRWVRVDRAGIASTVVMSVLSATAAGPLNNYQHFTNPLGIDLPGLGLLQVPAMLAYVGALFAAAASVIIRYRRSQGIERLQMRWFFVGAVSAIVAFALMVSMTILTGDVGPSVVLMSLLPICAGIAILRYRLFDIDRVISRTVTYAVVTALVVAPYLALAVLASRLASGSAVVVAALTLMTLAALRPVHRRVQRGVDRRFNRERYDATRTVDVFAARLRDEVDVERVRNDLLDVAESAMRPATISLWIAPSSPRG
jgi:hypothetical protein